MIPTLAGFVALCGVQSALGARDTTVPSGRVYVPVLITDSGITVVSPNPDSGDTGDPRGVTATFSVVNRGKKPHSFAFLGKTTGKIPPGGRGRITVVLLARGRFAYKSTLDRGKAFRGFFTVY